MAIQRGKAAEVSGEALKTEHERRGGYNDDRLDYLDSATPRLKWRDNVQNRWRFVPQPVPGAAWGFTIHVHRDVGPDGGLAICRKRQYKEPCCICEDQQTLWDTDPEKAKGLYPQERVLANAIDMFDTAAGVQVADMPKRKFYDEILGLCRNPENGSVINIAQVKGGVDVYFERQYTKGSYPKYSSIQLGREPNDVTALVEKEGVFQLEPLLVQMTYEELKKLYAAKAQAAPQTPPAQSTPPSKIPESAGPTVADLAQRMKDMEAQKGNQNQFNPAPGDPGAPMPSTVAATTPSPIIPVATTSEKGPFD